MKITGYLLTLSLSIIFSLSFPTYAAEVDLAEAVNKAGKQRMLSQRIAKAYFFLGGHVRRDKAKQQLQSSIIEFKKNHSELKSEIKSQDVQKVLALLDIVIDDYAKLVGLPYNQDNATMVLDLSETILEVSQDVVMKIEALSKLEKPKVVNISGRQRMLSQRIAKYYIAYQLGFQDQDSINQLNNAVNDFESAMVILKTENINTSEITAELISVTRLWRVIRPFFLDVEKGGLPVTIFATTDRIMDYMNTITGMYVNATG
ncbi:type IV pili methyl-accepting chemotaxis transducer N-terminal domain-containing protein [Candidatus Thiodiazotropha sp. CDECU1]|uniref:type IV pili methyl-accepting chemotaxis transducer N-terminal domain-containing protein n=1 Tax=Candidatus Thiodiazotropha sp. CDECU1 TaxID=3065865 RepID=UPI00292FA472|nr:type IV pili methyl-accepting chemotaxis transducer N-terminal domain-containing protein [Candidatus Thiodiazotropha sp. CDECU1]